MNLVQVRHSLRNFALFHAFVFMFLYFLNPLSVHATDSFDNRSSSLIGSGTIYSYGLQSFTCYPDYTTFTSSGSSDTFRFISQGTYSDHILLKLGYLSLPVYEYESVLTLLNVNVPITSRAIGAVPPDITLTASISTYDIIAKFSNGESVVLDGNYSFIVPPYVSYVIFYVDIVPSYSWRIYTLQNNVPNFPIFSFLTTANISGGYQRFSFPDSQNSILADISESLKDAGGENGSLNSGNQAAQDKMDEYHQITDTSGQYENITDDLISVDISSASGIASTFTFFSSLVSSLWASLGDFQIMLTVSLTLIFIGIIIGLIPRGG